MNQIHIAKNSEGNNPEIMDINTGGFLLLYLQGEVVKSTGTIEMKALAPLLLPLLMKGMAK